MRADNSPHLIKAAQQRADQTRRRAVAALRRMDATGKLTRPASPVPGSTPRPTCVRRSSGCERATKRGPPRPCLPTGNAPPRPPCCAALRPPLNGSVTSNATTVHYATRWPRPSANNAHPRSSAPKAVATRPTTRARNSSDRADQRPAQLTSTTPSTTQTPRSQ